MAPLVRFFFLTLFLATTAAASDLQFKNLKGEAENLAQYRGKIVALNFWATWCLPCREEMPVFVRLQERFASQGVQFIAASIDVPEDRKKVMQFADDFHLNFPVWVDVTLEQQASMGLGTAVPATAIFDRAGRLRFRIIGASSRKDLEKRFQYLLSENGAEPDELLLPPGITKEHFEQHHARLDSGSEDHHHEEQAPGGSEVPS